jgi:hypothetical protein
LLLVGVALAGWAGAGDDARGSREPGACCYDDGTCRLTPPEMCASLIGDANCDGAINFDDISPFVAVLSGGSVPACEPGNCDVNRDGAVNFDDISPFVALLGSQHFVRGNFLGPGTACTQCPPRLGDTCENPFLTSGSLPFVAFGNTCDFANDYDAWCPYDSMARDVVYQFSPAQDVTVDISLCLDETDYDTKVYVYDNICSGWGIACNDDGCSTPTYPLPYLSEIESVALSAGHTYYIVVDGYGQECGTYHLDIRETPSCDVPCPPGGTPENEPCHTNTNGGCGFEPPVFGHIACSETVCGTSYFDGVDRDTDWFLIDIPVGHADYIFTLTGEAEFDLELVLVRDDGADCYDLTLIGAVGESCQIVELTSACVTASSTYYAWVGPQFTTTFDCTDGHGRYWVAVTCVGCDIVPGACCRSGVCHADMTPADCAALGGEWQGPGSACDPNPCPPPPLGDTCADPYIIPPLLPFDTTGNTCSFTHDYDAVCPYSAPGARDTVYRFTPTAIEFVDITLCMDETDYDTKVYVFEDSCSGAPIACNDDYCATAGYPQHPYVSKIAGLLLSPGHDYYIVVDGYGSACGTYRLIVIPPPP